MPPDSVTLTFNGVLNRIFGPLIDDCQNGTYRQQLINANGFGFVR
jgi:hypothetical protein